MNKRNIVIAFIILVLGVLVLSTMNVSEEVNTTMIKHAIYLKSSKKLPSKYKLTHYGWDCRGCRGKTATGYNIKKTIWYKDKQYGKVRIVAMCSKMKLGSIIRIKNYKRDGDIIAIVIDRGVDCGIIDLAVKNEKTSKKYGIQKNVKIDILRKGW